MDIAFLLLNSTLVAQVEQVEPVNPLNIRTNDPLIPVIKRPLTPLERRKIQQTVVELNKNATAKAEDGLDEEAFALWYRELRLQRELGIKEEIEALSRVGNIAFNKNRKTDVRFITERLLKIEQQQQQQGNIDTELLLALGSAYQQIGNIDKAQQIYQVLLEKSRTQKDIATEEKALQNIAQLHLERFDYPSAALTYEELLQLARSQSNGFNEGIYVSKLAEIYTQINDPNKALPNKLKLAESYRQTQQLDKLAPLLISIASDYEALNKAQEASQNYQDAFKVSWSLQQFSTASEALTKLAALYLQYEQKDFALQVYQQLLKVEQQSYNLYGLMNTYDRIGQIYLEQKNYTAALAAFQDALEIAKSLQYQENYFANQIEVIQQQLKNPN